MEKAAVLFMQKGYDKTSIQDIMNETKLSKGAIYHHFTSKEDIFVHVCEQIGDMNAAVLSVIRDDKSLNGMEKLKQIFRKALLSENQMKMLNMVPYLMENPQFLVIQMRSCYEEVAPDYIQPILEEGIRDGSIHVEHPRELGEASMMLSDVWLSPLLLPTTPEQIRARCAVYNQLTSSYGIKLLDDDLIDVLAEYAKQLLELKDRRDRGVVSQQTETG